MRNSTIEKMCCPFDKADLELKSIKQVDDNVIEGMLTCRVCERVYPVISGIPIMNPDEYREFELEKPLYDRWKTLLGEKKVENFRLTLNDKARNSEIAQELSTESKDN